MKEILQWQKTAHYSASAIGGFLGGYTIFNHADIFGNAQTGNLIHLTLDTVQGKFALVLFMLLGFLVYCGGNVFYVLVRRRVKISMKIVSLICTAGAVALTGAISCGQNDCIAC